MVIQIDFTAIDLMKIKAFEFETELKIELEQIRRNPVLYTDEDIKTHIQEMESKVPALLVFINEGWKKIALKRCSKSGVNDIENDIENLHINDVHLATLELDRHVRLLSEKQRRLDFDKRMAGMHGSEDPSHILQNKSQEMNTQYLQEISGKPEQQKIQDNTHAIAIELSRVGDILMERRNERIMQKEMDDIKYLRKKLEHNIEHLEDVKILFECMTIKAANGEEMPIRMLKKPDADRKILQRQIKPYMEILGEYRQEIRDVCMKLRNYKNNLEWKKKFIDYTNFDRQMMWILWLEGQLQSLLFWEQWHEEESEKLNYHGELHQAELESSKKIKNLTIQHDQKSNMKLEEEIKSLGKDIASWKKYYENRKASQIAMNTKQQKEDLELEAYLKELVSSERKHMLSDWRTIRKEPLQIFPGTSLSEDLNKDSNTLTHQEHHIIQNTEKYFPNEVKKIANKNSSTGLELANEVARINVDSLKKELLAVATYMQSVDYDTLDTSDIEAIESESIVPKEQIQTEIRKTNDKTGTKKQHNLLDTLRKVKEEKEKIDPSDKRMVLLRDLKKKFKQFHENFEQFQQAKEGKSKKASSTRDSKDSKDSKDFKDSIPNGNKEAVAKFVEKLYSLSPAHQSCNPPSPVNHPCNLLLPSEQSREIENPLIHKLATEQESMLRIASTLSPRTVEIGKAYVTTINTEKKEEHTSVNPLFSGNSAKVTEEKKEEHTSVNPLFSENSTKVTEEMLHSISDDEMFDDQSFIDCNNDESSNTHKLQDVETNDKSIFEEDAVFVFPSTTAENYDWQTSDYEYRVMQNINNRTCRNTKKMTNKKNIGHVTYSDNISEEFTQDNLAESKTKIVIGNAPFITKDQSGIVTNTDYNPSKKSIDLKNTRIIYMKRMFACFLLLLFILQVCNIFFYIILAITDKY